MAAAREKGGAVTKSASVASGPASTIAHAIRRSSGSGSGRSSSSSSSSSGSMSMSSATEAACA